VTDFHLMRTVELLGLEKNHPRRQIALAGDSTLVV
jgi:hypothetical protein